MHHLRRDMRTTVNLDEQLVSEAQRLTGTQERTALIHEGLRALIARESARRLARLGGSDPRAKAPRRRRSASSSSIPPSGSIIFKSRFNCSWRHSKKETC